MSDLPPTPDTAAIVRRDPLQPEPMDDVSSQLLWLATQRRKWRSLAVVAASEGLSTIEVASMLAKLAWWYRGLPSSVADFRDLSLRLVDYQLADVAAQLERDPITIVIALRSIFENPTVLPVASAVDAAVLCVQLDSTHVRSARNTVERIGRDKFIGTIVLRQQVGGVAAPREDQESRG